MITKQHIRLQKIVLCVSIALLLIKFYAYFLTHSNAILTDAFESIANVVAAAFGVYSLSLAARPRDKNHPYGHGKIEFISASMEGGMVLLAGLIIIGKSVYNLFELQTVNHIAEGIMLVVISGSINFLFGVVLVKRGRKADSLTMIASGKHLQSDGWSTAGLVAGLIVFYFWPYPRVDSVIAILFGIYIAVQGFSILRKSIGGIMDEADVRLLNSVITSLDQNRQKNWMDVHNLRIIRYGATLHFDCHLTVPYYFSVKDGHAEEESLEKVIHDKYDSASEWFVHIDPCVPPLMCKICMKDDCTVREAAFEYKMEWNLENVLRNKKHGL